MKINKPGDYIKILTAGVFIIAVIASFSCAPKSAGNTKNTMTGTKVSEAERRGIERAEADIKSGNLKILYYGERSPEDDYPHYDKDTGLPMVNEEWGDLPYNEYPDEVKAYNKTIREYLKKQKIKNEIRGR
ncbi:MAG TPA: hypothetical protein PK514_15860 [Spirochaetota bacterium]|nr:hypothetical protein [Spirochaetota bacterium]